MAGRAEPGTAPNLVLAMEEEVRRMDREASLPENIIEDYMVRAFQITRDVMDALEVRKRSIDREIEATRVPQDQLAARRRRKEEERRQGATRSVKTGAEAG